MFVWSSSCGSKYPSTGKSSCTGYFTSLFTDVLRNEKPCIFMFRNVYQCLSANTTFVFQLDMQRGVHCRLMDNSTSVREAAVELLGRFVLSRPQLIEQYYDMLVERILVISQACLLNLVENSLHHQPHTVYNKIITSEILPLCLANSDQNVHFKFSRGQIIFPHCCHLEIKQKNNNYFSPTSLNWQSYHACSLFSILIYLFL